MTLQASQTVYSFWWATYHKRGDVWCLQKVEKQLLLLQWKKYIKEDKSWFMLRAQNLCHLYFSLMKQVLSEVIPRKIICRSGRFVRLCSQFTRTPWVDQHHIIELGSHYFALHWVLFNSDLHFHFLPFSLNSDVRNRFLKSNCKNVLFISFIIICSYFLFLFPQVHMTYIAVHFFYRNTKFSSF